MTSALEPGSQESGSRVYAQSNWFAPIPAEPSYENPNPSRRIFMIAHRVAASRHLRPSLRDGSFRGYGTQLIVLIGACLVTPSRRRALQRLSCGERAAAVEITSQQQLKIETCSYQLTSPYAQTHCEALRSGGLPQRSE